MDELELSIMERRLSNRQVLHSLLQHFEDQYSIHAQHQMLDWARGRSELIKVALYHHGPDVSEIGTTWISDLIAMNALRPFTSSEVDQLAPAGSFLPEAWKTARMMDDPQVWSIPWLAESLVLYYHKDLLEAAGVDPSIAFHSLEGLYEAVQQLKSSGYVLPIAVPPAYDRTMLLHIASTWVWQAGGEYITPDAKQVTFHDTNAVEGFKSFFRLLSCISAEGIGLLDQSGVASNFHQKKAPIAIAGAWLLPDSAPERTQPESNIGIARLPGQPFVGGSNLVIWKHTRQENLALELIGYLTQPSHSSDYGQSSGILSARSQSFSGKHYEHDRVLKVLFESIQAGRSFPTMPLWGLVEDRLATTISSIWQMLSVNPDLNVEETIRPTLAKVARSLNLTLSQQ
jgi:multiple sugar transport system substrate-binding protein